MADIDTRNKLKTFLLRTRRKTEGQGEAVIRFAEDVLPLFVRKYLDTDFVDISLTPSKVCCRSVATVTP